MITRIDKLQNLGIYKDFSECKIKDFNRYNLIYGWNGSGKSTLSRLFSFLGGRDITSCFNNFKVCVTIDNKQYTEKQLPSLNENIAVFNEDFVNDNIDWNGTLKSILLLDKDNITDIKELNSLKKELYGDETSKGLKKEIEEKEKELSKEENDTQNLLTNIAKIVKTNFKILDTSDSYYMNYDKRRVKALLETLNDKDILNVDELNTVIKQANPEKKQTISKKIEFINIDIIRKEIIKTKELISRSITSKVIDELKNNSILSKWVEQGLSLHKKEKRKICAFCGATISEKRIDELEAHFSNELNSLNDDLLQSIEKWDSLKYDEEINYIEEPLFYNELIEQIKTANIEYKGITKQINEEIEIYKTILLEKRNKPFTKYELNTSESKIIKLFNDFNLLLEKYKNYIDEHNNKTNNFEIIIKEAKNKIEKHYVQEQIDLLKYNTKQKNIEKEKKELNIQKENYKIKEQKYISLENKLSNATLGAEEFNEKLEKFLGYNELKLKFDNNEKGYKIYRNDKEEAKNLSEGEKTAIAFIYYITKLKENGRNIEDCILVIDDPISSFDSNKQFSAYAYMKSECDNAKQLFVLTHNYNFFSLILGWFNKKHKPKVKDEDKKMPNFSIYRIDNSFENDKRFAFLNDATNELLQATEYDYIFYTVYSLREKPLSKQERIFCGNICRKLIESFLSFKFPKQRGDLSSLLDMAEKNDIIRERIYKFVNIYSHEKKINVFEELDTEILDANSQMIIKDILDMIKRLDEVHYNSMVEKFN